MIGTLGLAAAWLVFLRPPIIGGTTTFVIVSGRSMEPALRSGDLVVVRSQQAYEHGDLVAFRAEGRVVVHRIVGGDAARGFRVRGDNRDHDDLWRPRPQHILGASWVHVPHAGGALRLLVRPDVLALVLGLLTFVSVLGVPRVERRRATGVSGAAVVALILLSTPAAALAAPLPTHSGQLTVFRYPASILPVVASVDIKPESLEKRSSGTPLLAFVELLSPDDVGSIDVASVRLCRGGEPCTAGVPVSGKPKIGDADGDGVRDLKLGFDRQSVISLVADVTPPESVSFTVSGLLGSTAFFAGSDVVKLVDPEP